MNSFSQQIIACGIYTGLIIVTVEIVIRVAISSVGAILLTFQKTREKLNAK